MGFICPVCGENLIESEKSYSCCHAHLFDKAKKGYVNLLLGRDASLHGDSKEMALARYDIMQSGTYAPVKNAVIALLQTYAPAARVIADCGCGEGYYTAAIAEAFRQAEVLGTDISKEVLAVAKRRGNGFKRAVASSFALPLANESCDVALNIFSPFAKEEYARIIQPGGFLLMVIPLEYHLWELKQAVYEKPYLNEPHIPALAGFSLVAQERLEYQKTLPSRQLIDLFGMTPYAIKTSPADKEKLNAVSALKITFSVQLLLYQKENEPWITKK